MEHAQRLRAAQYRLAQHYLDKLHTAQRTYQQGHESALHALALFDQEREQVQQWQAWAIAHASSDERAAAFCSDYARASSDIFRLRLPPQEYIALLETALEAARKLGDLHTEAVHLLEICEVSEFLVEYHQAIDYSRQALAIARQLADLSLVAQALYVCGIASRNQGNLEDAEAYCKQSFTLCQAMGNQRGMANAIDMLSLLALSQRKNIAAQEYLERCLVLYREIGDQEGIATCLTNLGFLATRIGNFTAANDYLQQALALHQTMGHKRGITSVLMNLGNVAYYQGEYVLARTYQEQVLTSARASGIQQDEASSLYKLGQVAMAQGNLLDTRDYFEQSLALSRSLVIGMLVPETLGNLAIIYLLLHQEAPAYAALREGLEIASTLSMVQVKLMLLVAATRVWILRGEPVRTATWLGLVENHPHPAVQMTDIKRVVQQARAECTEALSPEQFASAWEKGKHLDVDTVIADILNELPIGRA